MIAKVAIVVMLGLFGPRAFEFQRSAAVPGTPEQVWPCVSNLKNMALWSPWAEKDTVMVVEYTGDHGTVGSKSSWDGNDKVGKGSQTIVKLEPTTYAETTLNFMEPMENEATGYIKLADTTGGALVTWGIRGSMTFDKLKAFYGKSFEAIFPALEKASGKPASMPCGLYYNWDVQKGTTDLAAAVAFSGDIKAPKGMEVISLPPAKSLTINYMGGYSGIGKAHDAMEIYLNQNKLESLTPAIDEYVTDPGTEPDSNKWMTKITYFVK